jgi:hypothetical protein
MKELSMISISRRFSFLVLVLFVCGGCGGGKAEVTGVVQLDGMVVPGGRVVFTPASKENKPAFGDIQSDGTFEMMTEKPGDGVMIGQYRASYARDRAGENPLTRTSYLGPSDKLLDVVSGQNKFEINIRKEDGWEAALTNEGDE